VTSYLEDNADRLVRGKSILELGAGAGLPSLACATLGAKDVVATDYPDADLIENLRFNIDCCEEALQGRNISACGYLWGNEIESLTSCLSPETDTRRFDVLIMADILFNHSEHAKLIQTMRDTLGKNPNAVALVFFTPYRPWLLHKDLHFFDLAREHGFVVNKVLDHIMEKVMFEKDPGDEMLRRTVFGYEVQWPS
jgi:EEF1A N-terminal glycine/lysine methyltransferase